MDVELLDSIGIGDARFGRLGCVRLSLLSQYPARGGGGGGGGGGGVDFDVFTETATGD